MCGSPPSACSKKLQDAHQQQRHRTPIRPNRHNQRKDPLRDGKESPALLLSGHPLLAGRPSSSCPAWGVSRPRIRRLEADDQIGSGARIAPCAQCNLMLVRSWRHKKVKPMGNSGLLDDA